MEDDTRKMMDDVVALLHHALIELPEMAAQQNQPHAKVLQSKGQDLWLRIKELHETPGKDAMRQISTIMDTDVKTFMRVLTTYTRLKMPTRH